MVTNSVGWIAIGDEDGNVFCVETVCRECRVGQRLWREVVPVGGFWRNVSGRNFGLHGVDCSVCGTDELPWDWEV